MTPKIGAFRRAIPTGYLVYEVMLTGLTPLLMSNGEVDRDSDLYVAYETLAATRKKTREQKAQLRELEWLTRIYFDEKLGPCIPGRNLKELIREAATKTKDGMNVVRGLVIPQYRVALTYDGPRDLKGLWEGSFRYTVMVANAGAGSGRVDRTRPCFDEWSITFELGFDQEELDQKRFEDIIARTEKYGLGDGRTLGFGAIASNAEFVRIENADLRVDGTKARDKKAESVNKARAEKVMSVA